MYIYVLYYLIYWGINAYILYFLQMPKYLMLASSMAALLASGAAGLDESHLALNKMGISWKSLQICYLFETQSCSIRKSQLDPFL